MTKRFRFKRREFEFEIEFLHCLVLRAHALESGGNSEEVPPVPIPNTEVKLLSVYDTWRVTARENGTLPERIEIGETLVSPIVLLKLNIFSSKLYDSLRSLHKFHRPIALRLLGCHLSRYSPARGQELKRE